MLCIVYISSAVREFTDVELRGLLKQSQEKNARLEITGILLYKGGDVMQLLEGPDEAVEKLALTIYADPRHHGIIQLLDRQIAKREFADWSMDFRNLSISKVKQLGDFMMERPIEVAVGADPLSPMDRLLASFGFRG